jgi:integrase/recombinase XerC
MASVSSFYKFGMTRFPDEVQSNPFGAVRRPKVSQKSATRSLSMDQTLDLFDAAEASGPWDAVVVHVLLATGMRVSELVNAKVGDVKQHGDHHVVEIKRKGAKPDSVPLSPEALAAIRAYVGPRTGGTILLGDGPDGRSNRRAVGRALDRLARVVGVPLHPHRLRHTAATRALAAGATIERVSEMLGHDSILTTMRYLTSENAVDQSAVHELAEAYRSARETRQSREHCHNAFDDAPAVDSVNR